MPSLKTKLLALVRRHAGDARQPAKPDPADGILRIRIYLDGLLTLDGVPIAPTDLRPFLRANASMGRSVWTYLENTQMVEARHPVFGAVLNEMAQLNLELRISAAEDFSDCSDGEDSQGWDPSIFSYTPIEDNERQAGSQRELRIYLSRLKLGFDAFPKAPLEDDEIFHIVVALRPNKSKIWLIHPPSRSAEDMNALVSYLESQSVPTVNAGVLAFAIAIGTSQPASRPPSSPPLPAEWAAVSMKSAATLSPRDILDLIWPQ